MFLLSPSVKYVGYPQGHCHTPTIKGVPSLYLCLVPFTAATWNLSCFFSHCRPGAKTINVFRACLGAQLTICAQKLRNFVLFSMVSFRFVLSRVCVFLYSLGPRSVDSFRCRNLCSYNYTRSHCHTQQKVFRGHLYVSFLLLQSHVSHLVYLSARSVDYFCCGYLCHMATGSMLH